MIKITITSINRSGRRKPYGKDRECNPPAGREDVCGRDPDPGRDRDAGRTGEDCTGRAVVPRVGIDTLKSDLLTLLPYTPVDKVE